MSDTAVVILPTYNEADNVRAIVGAILERLPGAHVLVVDDNSPDGTGRLADELATADPRVHVLHRAAKEGLGRAYLAGFRWALDREYEFIFEMDADFSHDPAALPAFIEAARRADLVLGSRYRDGIRVVNWPLRRLLLSTSAAKYVRVVTGMPFTDPTGGFKCFRRAVLNAMDLDQIQSNGYSFQIEMTYQAWMRGFQIAEVPIVFEDRRAGQSKMNANIIEEALGMVLRLCAKNGFRRRPGPLHPDSVLARADKGAP